MSIEENTIGQIAVKIATQGESENIGKPKIGVDFKEFWHFIGIWLMTAGILFGSLLILTIVKGSDTIFKDTIKEVDTLNIFFGSVSTLRTNLE